VAVDGAPLGLVGAGTGLGVSGLIPGKDGWTALLSEGAT
jgi:glucokinase